MIRQKTSPQIALFLPSMAGGGAERVTANLANGLLKRGMAVDLVLIQARGPILARLSDNVRIVNLQARGALACIPSLVRYLRQKRPAILLSALDHPNISAIIAGRLAGGPTRIAVATHQTVSANIAFSHGIRSEGIRRSLRFIYPLANDIITVSRGTACDLAQVAHVPLQKIHVLPNPVVSPEMLEMAKVAPQHPWFGQSKPPIVVTVGSLIPVKDHATLLRAFAQVRARRPVRLLILGEGPERVALKTLAEKLHIAADIELPGFVENPYSYMAHASVFALSSRSEALPTVLIEALACGAPVVSTDCPYGPREILSDGKWGQLCPVGNPNTFSAALENVLNGSMPQPSNECWKPYEVDHATQAYLQVLLPRSQQCVV